MAANGFDNDQTRSFTNLAAGTKVSHYKIISKIGAGGMGEVYLAEDTQLDRKVALKFLPPHLSQDEAARARFTREAKAAAKLDHPNIVQVFEVGEFQGRPFFAMAHIEGKSLREVIKEGKLSVNEAVEFTKQICEGLHKAHESGVVHRDIKPGNIIIDGDNKARILDFGLATVAGEDKLTKTGSTLGTVGYMSPEQIEGKKADHRSDLFSVGVILYEMLTGRRPFEGDNDAAVARSITDTAPEPIARYKSGTTGELQQIVDKALSKDPSLRYQTAAGMLADLKRLSVGTAKANKSRVRLLLTIALLVIVSIAAYIIIDSYQISTKPKDNVWTNSIAVLVFRDLSPEKDQDWFCEGMTEEIINRLQTIKELKTISIQSVLRFKESASEMKEIAKELSVDHVLIGSVQPDGDSIRVRAQLIHADDEMNLWSERFERERGGVFKTQDEIANSITEALKIELTSEQTNALMRKGTDNIEAYNVYLQGRFFWRKRNEKDLYKALEKFEKAIELDPNYAEAYAGVADVWNVLPGYSNLSKTEILDRAREAAQKALELNDNLAEAHASMGSVYQSDMEIEKAEEEYLKSLEISHNYPWAHVWYAVLYYNHFDDLNLITEHLNIALELDPLSTVAMINLAFVKRDLGEFNESGRLIRKALEIEPSNINFLGQYTFHWAIVGEKDSAFLYAEKAIELEPDNWSSHYYYGTILLKYDKRDEAIEHLRVASTLSPNNYLPLQKLGGTYWSFGYIEKAIDYFNRAIAVNPKAHVSYNKLAYCYAANDNHREAIKAISKAIEIDPYLSGYIDTRADINTKFGHFDKAISDYKLFLEASSNPTLTDETIRECINAAMHAGDYELADSLLNVRLEVATPEQRPGRRRATYKTLRHQGKFKQYVEKCHEWMVEEGETLIDNLQLYSTVYNMAIINMYYLNDLDSALAQFTYAKELAWQMDSTINSNVQIRGRITEVFSKAGEEAKARQALEDCRQVIDSSMSYNTFLWYSALAEYHLGNLDSALALLEKIPWNEYYYNILKGHVNLLLGRIDVGLQLIEKQVTIYSRNRLTGWPEWSVLGHYYLGQAYEVAGRTTEAIKQYEIFLNIWKNADEGLKSVEDARIRLARLKKII